MRLEKCYFCSSTVYPGHGVQFVRNDCKIFRFCRSKCHKNFKKKKNPRKAKWTKSYRKTAGKELCVDPSFEFEKHRDIPVKYNRELWEKSVDAMKRVHELRLKREGKFVMDRLKKGIEIEKQMDIHEVKKHMHVIRSPAAGLKRKKEDLEEEMDLEEEVAERVEVTPSTSKGKEKRAKVEVQDEEELDKMSDESDDGEDNDDEESGESESDDE
jgi:large subunit ribosomal protein L24e